MDETPCDPVRKDSQIVQIQKVGDKLGLILSDELLERLNLGEGDKFYIVAHGEGGITLTPCDPEYARTMEIARRSFVDYAETYKALAK